MTDKAKFKRINRFLNIYLAFYKRNGGVMDYNVISKDKLTHKDAAIIAMKKMINAPIYADKMYCNQTTKEDFLGKLYDLKNDTVKMPYNNVMSIKDLGYSYSFFFPKDGLQLTLDKTEKLFKKINKVLFNNFIDDLNIYKWTTNWSDYFKTAKKAGVCFYTIENKTKDIFIVISSP